MVTGIIHVSNSAHGDTVLWFNTIHGDFLNAFFKLVTFGGDGIFYGVVALCLLIFMRRHGYVFLLVGLVVGLISTFMKRILFEGTPRPRKYFEGQQVLDLIEGVRINDFNSFPSGHTMTAFATATFLAFIVQRKEWSIILLLYAVMVGISRMYLNQHFLVDVVAGSIIGVIVSAIFCITMRGYMDNLQNKLSD